ncbi:MAG: 5'/3'-nucleotidase SurE [Bacteroidales bacterium]|nr:5'/3'-nucleotidase SurE [Bacteroidales bacterium]
MTAERPLILISNDDGIEAKGIKVLAEVAAKYGDVVVAAPNKGYSGQSHSFTVGAPLRVRKYDMGIPGVDGLMVWGSPVDCIKLGYHGLVSRKPDLILSGINHGTNTSSSVHYSGTLAAAREAALLGVKGIGFSIDDESKDADFTHALPIVERVISWALGDNGPSNVFYSVNIPYGNNIRGIKTVRIANGYWREDYHSAEDPDGDKYYWLMGSFIDTTKDAQDTDVYWLQQGYATLCPCMLDATNYTEMERLSGLF